MNILTSIVALVALAFGSVAYATDCHVANAVVADYNYAAPIIYQPLVAIPVYAAASVSDYQPVVFNRNIVQKNVVRVQQPQRVVVRNRVVRQRQVQKVQKVVEVQKVQKVVQVQKVQKVRAVHGHAIQQLNAAY